MGGCLSRRTGDFDPTRDLLDLTGKVVLVTGGNTGIGYHTVKILARRGAKVYLGARSEAKALEAIKQLEIDDLGPYYGKVIFHKVDYGNPRWAKQAAEEFMEREERLDILINNAAQITGPYEITKDGISTIAIVNHFSPFVFTRTLLPLLKRTALQPQSDVRIITLSSIAHTHARAIDPDIRFREISDFNGEFAGDVYPEWSRYSVTKLANLLFARELQRRLDDSAIPIVSIPIHPGEVNTFASRTPYPALAYLVMGLFFMQVEPGSYTSCFAAASPKIRENPEKWGGVYLEPVGKRGAISVNAQRSELGVELWETTERILSDLGI